MSILACPKGALLISNLIVEMRHQSLFQDQPSSSKATGPDLDSPQVQAAIREARNHVIECPICRIE
jgi:hypothetical protein